ncbi:unnamed protein product, partial [Laminaria digitata]
MRTAVLMLRTSTHQPPTATNRKTIIIYLLLCCCAAGREDSSEHVPAVDGHLHHLDASTVSVVRAALQGSFLLPLRATTGGSIYHRLSPIDPVLTLCVIDAALMLRSNRNSSNGISAAGREGSSSTFLLLSSILTYTTHTLCILLRKKQRCRHFYS